MFSSLRVRVIFFLVFAATNLAINEDNGCILMAHGVETEMWLFFTLNKCQKTFNAVRLLFWSNVSVLLPGVSLTVC